MDMTLRRSIFLIAFVPSIPNGVFCRRIGEGVVITPEGKPTNADGENYFIRDGVVVVPKGAVVPDGTLI